MDQLDRMVQKAREDRRAASKPVSSPTWVVPTANYVRFATHFGFPQPVSEPPGTRGA
jgi:hypothetical protein